MKDWAGGKAADKTLREELAMAAMQGLLANETVKEAVYGASINYSRVAAMSVQMADYMLQELNKPYRGNE